jgi:DNA helicase IV
VGLVLPDALATEAAAALSRAGIAHVVLGEPGDVESRVDLVPATLAKGLEFDSVVLIEPAAIAAAEPDFETGVRRLYVCLTRAVTTLTVVHAEPLPDLLAA